MILPYEHFSIVMHKQRRLALFAASNVDTRPDRKKPETRKDYSRRALSGLGENDQEKWFTDPRIPGLHQLPDRFFTQDQRLRQGHIVRREDVAWGTTYEELRRADGDTYHVTGPPAPQVAGFNRSNLGVSGGSFQNLVIEQSKAEEEKYSLFAGLVLDPDDKVFLGRDVDGAVRVKIPSPLLEDRRRPEAAIQLRELRVPARAGPERRAGSSSPSPPTSGA